MTDTAPGQELDALMEAVRNGDTTITAAQIAKAQDAVTLAGLHADAARRQLDVDANERLERARSQVREEQLVPLAARLDRLRASYGAAVTATRGLIAGLDEYATARREAIRHARTAGIAAEAEALPPLDSTVYMKLAIDESRGRPAGGSPVGYPYRVERHALLNLDVADAWDREFAERHATQQARSHDTWARATNQPDHN